MEKSIKETKKIKRETKVQTAMRTETKPVQIKKPSEAEVLEAMEIGVLYTSSQLADALKLTGETRRDKIRQAMYKLAKDGKVRISEAKDRKGKMYLYELSK